MYLPCVSRLTLVGIILAVLIPSVVVQAQEYAELTPELDARAAGLYDGIMCPICNGQTISQSHSEIAATMRQMVKERLLAGDSDAQIYAFMVEAFGRDILASPPTSGIGLAAWVIPPVALLLGAVAVTIAIRRLRRESPLVPPDQPPPGSDDLARYLAQVDLEMKGKP